MKKILLTLLALGYLQIIHAQSPEVRARATFMNAQELYGNGDFVEAIDLLESVKELLGSTNPRVEYLLAQSHFANKNSEMAEMAMKKYFEMADDSDPNYNQMLLMVEEIKTQKEEVRLENARREELAIQEQQEKEMFKVAKLSGKPSDYQNYITKYPEGRYKAEATAGYRKGIAEKVANGGDMEASDYLDACHYYMEQGKDFRKALELIDTYLAFGDNSNQFWNVYIKANILTELKEYKEAKNMAKLSLELASNYPKGDFGYIKKNNELLERIKRKE
ncbi:MAG: hypothetical protein RIF46_14365 [Cyclobacteriaceae bacterium]